ncbi:hypothetical protein D3C73_1453480 [compost metagenome]
MVRQEGDPPLNPQWVGQVSVHFRQQSLELAVAVGIDPQLPGSAATVALPPGGLT